MQKQIVIVTAKTLFLDCYGYNITAMIYYTKLNNRGILRVSGEDRLKFLQGLLTNDINSLTKERSIYSLLLTVKGKHAFDLFLVMVGEECWIEADRDRLEELKKKLSIYKLRSKINLEIDLTQNIFCIYSDKMFETFDLLPDLKPELGCTKHITSGHIYIDPRLKDLGVRIITTQSLDKIIPIEDSKMVAMEEYCYHRYGLGVPESSKELLVDKSIPLENGMDELHAINWDKGCYMGQELTARTKYRGLVRKRLFPITSDRVINIDTPILAEGLEVGKWCGFYRDRGLALLRLEAMDKILTCEDAILSVIRPNWMQLLTE